MARTVRGSAFYDDFGGCMFTPYNEGDEKNKQWLTLKTIDGGKLDCSKNKVRITMTLERSSVGAVCSSFMSVIGKLISVFMSDKRVQRFYEMAKDMKPCEITEEEEEIPTHG